MSPLPIPDFSAGSPHMTFGVELEFMLRYRKQAASETDTVKLFRENPKCIIVPHDLPAERDADFCMTIIGSRLARAGFAVSEELVAEGVVALGLASAALSTAEANAANTDRSDYQRWKLECETLDVPPGQALLSTPHHSFAGLELISPALSDRAERYAEVAAVAALVKEWYGDNVITSAEAGTGLHVHVGMGREIDCRSLRQMAALLWALDTLFTPLHPASRAENIYCRRNRESTTLFFDHGAGLMQGVQALLECSDTFDVGMLMRCILGFKPAYAFHSFLYCETDPSRKPTVEFRQAAGTMNPAWIAVWARICVRTCAAATAYTPDQLLTIAHLCERVEDDSAGKHDYVPTVGDFLQSIGCLDEARYLQRTTPNGRVLSPAHVSSRRAC